MTTNEIYFLIGVIGIIVALFIHALYKYMCKTIETEVLPRICLSGYPLLPPFLMEEPTVKKEVWYPWKGGLRPEFCEDVTSVLYADGRISAHWGNIAWASSWTWNIKEDERIIAYTKGEYKNREAKDAEL